MEPRTTQKLENESQQLSDKLCALFKNHNLRVTQVAQALGIPVMTIRRLMSGETTDPRTSTLKLIADYFDISIDALLDKEKVSTLQLLYKTKPLFVPVLDWSTAENINTINELDLSNWKEWQSVPLSEQDNIGKNAFALAGRPSMYPRFPQNTIFIFDPDIEPTDGNIVLVKIKKNNELTLRELTIDPPEWQLHPIASGSKTLQYNAQDYGIVGINVLTLLYNRRK